MKAKSLKQVVFGMALALVIGSLLSNDFFNEAEQFQASRSTFSAGL